MVSPRATGAGAASRISTRGTIRETVNLATVRRAWVAWTLLLRENCKNVARQLAIQFGGKLGLDIEAASRKFHTEMFERLRADPLLTGEIDAPSV